MQVLFDNLPLLLVASVFAPLTAWFAAQRARTPGVWFVFGALLGPLGLGLLALAPPGHCPNCATPVRGWLSACTNCGTPLGGIWRVADGVGVGLVEVGDHPAADPGTKRGRPRAPVSAVATASPVVAVRMGQDAHDPSVAEVLSTGIYLTGSAGLELGAMYALARRAAPGGDRFRVFGPVDTGQMTVRHEILLAELEVTVVNERIIISGRTDRSLPTFVFQAVGGMRGPDLERAFADVPLSPP